MFDVYFSAIYEDELITREYHYSSFRAAMFVAVGLVTDYDLIPSNGVEWAISVFHKDCNLLGLNGLMFEELENEE